METVNLPDLIELVAQQQINSNHIWTMTAAAMVLFMQAGFLFLEAGMSRSKSSINVAQKNICDFLLSVSVFYLFGFGLMFGTSWNGFVGGDNFMPAALEEWGYTFFVFQAVFVATAATILSGAVAERMKYAAYIVIAIVIAAVIYPVFGHWAWGNLLDGSNPAYLADKGFIDFAGSTVVHSVGAWAGLAGIIVLGARVGKFDKDGKPLPLPGHSYVLATAGAIILWFGWIGFNGGSTTTGDPGFAPIVANTILAAAFGGTASLIIGACVDEKKLPSRPINGSLAGLVGITAGCDAVGLTGAVAIGTACGVMVVASEYVIERGLKLDDVVGAVSVHGTCGALGTVLLAFFALPEKLVAETRMEQALIQLEGVGLAFIWTFGIAYAVFKLLDMTVGIRVSREDETLGLNTVEHGITLGTGVLQQEIVTITKNGVNLAHRLDTTTGDEAAEIAMLFNPLLKQVHDLVGQIRQNANNIQKGARELGDLSHQSQADATDAAQSAQSVHSGLVRASENAHENGTSIAAIRTKSNEINADAESMADEISVVADSIRRLVEGILLVSQKTEETNSITADAEKLSLTAETQMKDLTHAAAEIHHVIHMIKSISDQINMLALNAHVEAARAGETGKGFKVVAEQVRELAAETAVASERIGHRVKEIQDQASSAEGIVGDVRRLMDQIHSAVSDIFGAVEGQRSEANEIGGLVSTTTQRAQQVSDATRDVSQETENLSQKTEQNLALFSETTAASAKLRENAAGNAVAADKVTLASDGFQHASAALSDSIGKFRIDTRNRARG